MTLPRKDVDWEGIERDYRAGILTLRQIAETYGTTHVTVFNRAKKEGWDRDLAAKIAAKAEALLNKQSINENLNDSLSEREVVESNARVVAIVALAHRRDIKGLRELAAKYKDELEDCEEDLQRRAAIIEFDAGMPRRAAEAMAMQEVLAMQSRAPAPAVAHVRA